MAMTGMVRMSIGRMAVLTRRMNAKVIGFAEKFEIHE